MIVFKQHVGAVYKQHVGAVYEQHVGAVSERHVGAVYKGPFIYDVSIFLDILEPPRGMGIRCHL